MKFTFSADSPDDSTYYDDVYDDFHPHVSNIYFEDDGTFTVTANHDFIERVFNREEKEGSGLCQNYTLLVIEL